MLCLWIMCVLVLSIVSDRPQLKEGINGSQRASQEKLPGVRSSDTAGATS